ncbi:hypothetical protein [Novipirellula sp.]|uniref:hypothetical protein n=1 Tax=Novipirellula sp. TaxID=2795430 RepID=UPI00356594AC
MYRNVFLAAVTFLAVASGINATILHADDPTTDGKSVLQRYTLRYSLKTGEKLHYQVTHAAKTKTRIRGAEEISTVHTVSQRHWDVLAANADGETTIDHIVDSVEMTQQQGEQEEVRWDSLSDEEPPAIFGRVSEQIGKKLSTLTFDSRGVEIKRENHGGTKASLGMGTLTLQLPEEALAIGDSWSVPHEVKARLDNGEVKVIKIRERYTLDKVQTGVATLSLRSEPLTPINEESVRAQVVQQLSNGTIRFDIDNGRMLSKQLDWDETVVGFQGANSLMEYRSRMTEKLVDGVERTAQKP